MCTSSRERASVRYEREKGMKRTRGTSGQGGHTKLGQESDKSPRNEMRVLMFVTKASLKIDALFIQ